MPNMLHLSIIWLILVVAQNAHARDFTMIVKNKTPKWVTCDSSITIDFEAATSGAPPFNIEPGTSHKIVLYVESLRSVLLATLANCSVRPFSGPPLGADKKYMLKIIYNPEGAIANVSNGDDDKNSERRFELGRTQRNIYYSIYSIISHTSDSEHFRAQLTFEKTMSRQSMAGLEATIGTLEL